MAVQGASENGLLLISDGTARRLSARIALNRAIFTTSRPGGAPEFERAPSRADRGRATGSDGPRSPLCRPGRPKHGHGAAGRGTGREEPDAGPTNVMVGSGAAMAPQNPELVIIMEATELSSVIRVNNTAQQRLELRESERGSVQRSTTCVAAPRSPDLHLLRGLRNGKPFSASANPPGDAAGGDHSVAKLHCAETLRAFLQLWPACGGPAGSTTQRVAWSAGTCQRRPCNQDEERGKRLSQRCSSQMCGGRQAGSRCGMTRLQSTPHQTGRDPRQVHRYRAPFEVSGRRSDSLSRTATQKISCTRWKILTPASCRNQARQLPFRG